MKFHVGDEVVCIYDHPDCNSGIVNGTIGRVKAVKGSGYRIAVEWDTAEEIGHSCEGYCKDGYGWWVNADQIEHRSVDLAEFDSASNDDVFGLIFGGIDA